MRLRHKLLAHNHTGKLRPHHHTSYGSLAFILVSAIAVIVAASQSTVIAAATDPVTGQEGIYAVVPAAAITAAPSITNLAANATITAPGPSIIQGNCPSNTLVKLYKNGIFGGSAVCQNGRYSLNADLFIGPNDLTLAAFNANNVSGPLSVPLHVTRALPADKNSAGLNAAGQLTLTSDIAYRGTSVGQPLSFTITVNGGQAPYAISIGWGDASSDLYSREGPGSFTVQHVYHNAGTGSPANYKVTVQATDQAGMKAFLQLTSIVTGGQPTIATSIRHGFNISTAIRYAWYALGALAIIVIAFWLGERREKIIVKRSGVRNAW